MGNDFTTAPRPAIVVATLFALLLGIGYPLAMTGVGQAILHHQANGSLVTAGGSGLDPDISPASALAQTPRVAGVRGVPVGAVRALDALQRR